MFSLSFRRKSSKKSADRGGPPYIRQSPSLPELSAQGIPWPEAWVDVSGMPPANMSSKQEKPMNNPSGGPISSLYTSHPPSAFDKRKSAYTSRQKPSGKKNRNPSTFNIMVVGGQGTGKTSLLRLLLETAEVSPTATPEQRAAVERFVAGPTKRTNSIETACVEICESKYDCLQLTVIDTPGLDFLDELRLEHQVSSIVKYIDEQFTDTLREESKVVRQSKGDQHVHLCIYAIDPARVTSAAERRYTSPFPATKTRSVAPEFQPAPELSTTDSTASTSDSSYDDSAEELSVSPTDIAVMRRLAKKANLLPIIAHADSLTDDTLDTIKKVVRRDLAAAGLDFGVFGPAKVSENAEDTPTSEAPNGTNDAEHQDEEDPEPEEERRSRPVIKLRASRNPFKLRFSSRSRTRQELTENPDEPITAEIMDNESVASVRFSAQIVAKTEMSDLLPFALIAPEYSLRRRPRRTSRPVSGDRQSFQTDTGMAPSDDGHGPGSVMSHSSSGSRQGPYLNGPPADLKGVFVRKFRWGTVDVLSPGHCDFAALRTAVLSTHMKMLKIRTKEVLYERYRTEKLLARRATKNINDADKRRMLEELGL